MGSKKLKVWLPLLFSLVMVLGMVIGYQLKGKTTGNRFFNTARRSSLQELVELIRNRYVDKVSADSINELAATELLSHLDPHSIYIPAAYLDDVNEELMGNFQGIGVEFQLFDDTVNVMNVIKDGPSARAGIRVGDKFLAVNDSIALAGRKLNPDDIRKRLRGPASSSVTVKILRGNEVKNITIERGVIPVASVDVGYMMNATTGFIRINKFGDRTYEEFMTQLEKLQKEGMKELILDLRGNGGGLLKEATAIADEFLSDDKLIVYTEGEHVEKYEYHCKRPGLFETGKLTVLIDETSASASEVLSGALQDWDRATIIGRRSFGKGLVQQQFQLSDGGAVRLTIARYFTPLGRNIQKSYTKGKKEYEEELVSRFQNGEMVKGDTSKHETKPYKTPGGRIVYGGGGITPDVFVPYDTTRIDSLLMKLYRKNLLSSFVYRFYMQHPELSKAKSALEIPSKFMNDENDWNAFVSYVRKDSIYLDAVAPKDRGELVKQLRAQMGRQIWRAEGYFEVANLTDPTVLKALELIKK
ncbi:S41 family peptidase [Sediminibacterium ginsengisoli]|uniref:C-terminal processing peptidase-3. Serine peptidase. MEROPS family S41A n=1 Tax=Sediminibacterium ginsengisoli TaxID=413434 RepID=A0A1T4L5E8_9BACT|nr:S41 family peptidase [Sediminibacterium ginsengisoli]SJZ49904.1 C-terminal processing peptidase-3. Serine peptidase. MEROPS family S41A [Sediminibacterium ginsengisoli]